jgi:hypothetical protein
MVVRVVVVRVVASAFAMPDDIGVQQPEVTRKLT